MGRQSAPECAPAGGHRASGWASRRVHWDSTRAAVSRKRIRKSLLLHRLPGKGGKSCLAGTAIALQQGRQGQLFNEDAAYHGRMGHGND
jgi:hypothetical protein